MWMDEFDFAKALGMTAFVVSFAFVLTIVLR